MVIFLDSSALLKRYVREQGTDEVDRMVRAHPHIAVAPITPVELHAALGRRLREGSLDPVAAIRAVAEITGDMADLAIPGFDQALVDEAIVLVRTQPLRSLDAIQLAAARLVRPGEFITADRALHRVAARVLICPCRLLDAA